MSHLCIQVVQSSRLELMLNCHILALENIKIGLILECAMIPSKKSAQLVYFEIWDMDCSVPRVVRLIDDEEVLAAAYSESGMPYVGLTGLLQLPNIVVLEVIRLRRFT